MNAENNESKSKNISTHILIGPNGTGKSILLKEKIKMEEKEGKNIFFLNNDFSFNDEVSGKGEGFASIDSFISRIFVIKYEVKKIIENDQINLTNINDKIISKNEKWHKSNNDIDFVDDIFDDILKKNKLQNDGDTINVPIIKLEKLTATKIKKIKGGSGQKLYTFLSFLSNFIKSGVDANFSVSSDTCLYIDEPERLCHPNLIFKIVKLVFELSKNINLRIVTHSPLFMNSLFQLYKKNQSAQDIEIFKFTNNEINSKLILDKNTDLENMDYESISKEGKNIKNLIISNQNFSELLKKNIITIPNISFNFFKALFSEKIFLVEGQNDWFFIEELILQNKHNFNYQIIPCWSKSNIIEVAKPLLKFFESNDKQKNLKITLTNLAEEIINSLEKSLNSENQKDFTQKQKKEIVKEKETIQKLLDEQKWGKLEKKLNDFCAEINQFQKYIKIKNKIGNDVKKENNQNKKRFFILYDRDIKKNNDKNHEWNKAIWILNAKNKNKIISNSFDNNLEEDLIQPLDKVELKTYIDENKMEKFQISVTEIDKCFGKDKNSAVFKYGIFPKLIFGGLFTKDKNSEIIKGKDKLKEIKNQIIEFFPSFNKHKSKNDLDDKTTKSKALSITKNSEEFL